MTESEIIDIFASDLRPMEYWAMRAEDKVAQWRAGIPDGYSTGFRALDELVSLAPTELSIIAARPGMGKTTLGMQMAQIIAEQLQREQDNGCVAVFSAEMSGWWLYLRMASALSGANIHEIRRNRANRLDVQKMEEAISRLRHLPIWIDDCSNPTTPQMLQRLSDQHANIPIRMMLFDFLELGGNQADSEEKRLSLITHELKAIAKTLEIPVVAISQLNRAVESRGSKLPGLADLRYSGMIEQIADNVLFIMRPEYYRERGMEIPEVPVDDQEGVAYVQVAKNKNGPVGLVKLAFIKQLSKFANLERKRVEL